MPPRAGGHKYCEVTSPCPEPLIRDQHSGIDESARRATLMATCEAPGVELRSSRATRQRPFITGGSGSILLKNSFSVQRQFFNFMEMQPKIRGKHNIRLAEKV
jgi:hypothetical protein